MVLKSSSRSAISPFMVMDMLALANRRAAKGEKIIHLELGEPSAPLPERVRKTLAALIGQDIPGYTNSCGIPALRERIAGFYNERYALSIEAADIIVTTGSSGAFILAFLAAFDPGDKVALAQPGYPAYRHMLHALGLIPVPLHIGTDNGYQLTLQHLESLDPDVAGLLLASPSNPTGTMLSQDRLAALCRYCDQRGIRLISDEIYHGITYDEPAQTARHYSQTAIIINSFSKYFALPGWRLGWMIAPRELRTPIERLAQNLYISTSSLAQQAALSAFDCLSEFDTHITTTYGVNRDLLLKALPQLGLSKIAPSHGAFYLYIDVSPYTASSTDFCARLLAETGIAMTPGIDFDPQYGHNFIRLSYSAPIPRIQEAIEKLRIWLQKQKGGGQG